MVFLGTAYDIALRYRILRMEEQNRNIDSVITEMKILKSSADIEDDITMSKLWSVKAHNGSLGNN